MADNAEARKLSGTDLVHAVLLGGIIPLFLGALLSDLAYASSYHVQWKNFASWLIAGGLVFGVFALLWAVADCLRADVRRDRRRLLSLVLLLAVFVVGLINALVHARDAWGSMPASTILSLIGAVLAIAATWAAFASRRVPR